ncbi:hypothetical protein [Macrococcoides caseolyticum]|uniref:hypothetical protein n=1 Tax=Macrococcoides caseolyticum TaxID=69966 RepID=UPI001F4067D5|nr:hypothetical protein [Macrococcus caseolyticus]MCE4956427.1 hypothetical protein [Macrococcus caseolyticus]
MLKFFNRKKKETKSPYPPKHATKEYNPDAKYSSYEKAKQNSDTSYKVPLSNNS